VSKLTTSWYKILSGKYKISQALNFAFLTVLVGVNFWFLPMSVLEQLVIAWAACIITIGHFFLPVPISAGCACCTSWFFLRWFSESAKFCKIQVFFCGYIIFILFQGLLLDVQYLFGLGFILILELLFLFQVLQCRFFFAVQCVTDVKYINVF